jgi:hypothetical protein
MAININKLWNDKTNSLSDKVWNIAKGDDDLYQEGIIGIRDGLFRDPHATDSYLLQSAKFAMANYRNRGKSIDNGCRRQFIKTLRDGTVKTYRKDMRPIYIDALMDDFQLEFPDSSYAPDILAIDKVSAERFYVQLDEAEAELVYACILTLDATHNDARAREMLNTNADNYSSVKRSAHDKFIQVFGDSDTSNQSSQ